MNAKIGRKEAIHAFIVTTGASLITLWQAVETFDAVPETAYATAIIGGIIAAAQAWKSRRNNSQKV